VNPVAYNFSRAAVFASDRIGLLPETRYSMDRRLLERSDASSFVVMFD